NDPVVRAELVQKSYDGLSVLRGVTFEVGRGEVKVIIGPSGSGKSTLLRCLALLEPVDAGAVYLDGVKLSGVREKELAPHRAEVRAGRGARARGARRDGGSGARRDDDGGGLARAPLRAPRCELDPDDGRGADHRGSRAREVLLLPEPRANAALPGPGGVTFA